MSEIEHADFTPSAPNFKELVLMNFQGLTNFPYIEEDFDALTNYGLLSKVVEYLNEVISNNNEQNDLMTSLYNAYVSLQNYVNNYFDNLDVQDEINNKLDQMAITGELTTLIKRYVDPIYEAYENEINEAVENQNEEIANFKSSVNTQIDVIDTKVTNAVSGSPLVASSISGMTNTNRVYVNTTDGKWYYYDGDSWEIGGTYQSTGIGLNEVEENMLSSTVKKDFSLYEYITDFSDSTSRSGAITFDVTYLATIFINTKFCQGDVVEFIGDNTTYRYMVGEISAEHAGDTTTTYDGSNTINITGYNPSPSYVLRNNSYIAFTVGHYTGAAMTEEEISAIPSMFQIKRYNTNMTKNKDLENEIKYSNTISNELFSTRLGTGSNISANYSATMIVNRKLKAGTVVKPKNIPTNYRYGVMQKNDILQTTDVVVGDTGWQTSGDLTTGYDGYLYIALASPDNSTPLPQQYVDNIKDYFEIHPNNYINSLDISETTDYVINYDDVMISQAHRGLSALAPENTIPAFKLAKKNGFNYVETDVAMTSDNIPVLIHDSTINRTARNADGTTIEQTLYVKDLTYQQLLQYDFGIWKGQQFAGTKIPTLYEFIKLCKNINLTPNIEIIERETFTNEQLSIIYNTVSDFDMTDKVMWSSGSLQYMTYIKTRDPKATLLLNASWPTTNYIDNAITLKTNENTVYISAMNEYTTNESITYMNQNGIKLCLWPIDDISQILIVRPYVTMMTSNIYNAGKILFEDAMED